MENIPSEPMMLLSYLNTQLRDFYPSLDELCKSLNIEEEFVIKKMTEIDYCYDGASNRFL